MRRLWIVAAVVLASVSLSQAAIVSINVSDVTTSFSTVGGDYQTGLLTISGSTDIVIENDLGNQSTYTDGTFSLVTSLQSDNSAGGMATGSFGGGSLTFKDSFSVLMFSGDVISFNLAEVFDGMGVMGGQGTFDVTGGYLQSSFVESLGEIYSVTFRVAPASISDFATDFTGRTDLSVIPIPEPTTICLLGLGALGLLRIRRK